MNRFANLRPATLAPENLAASRSNRRIVPALRLSLLTAIFGVISTAAAQTQQPAVQMSQPDASSLRLRFDNPTMRPVYLAVLNLNNGELVLSEIHREAAYGTRLLFDKLPAGSYAVSLRVGRDRYRYAVQVAANAAGKPTIAVRETTTHRVESGLATARL
ncbi:hypothetical protein MON38_16395 [Hymenobacter sp. DH14]|uniref:Uncharacterized protein n=1 Tax=Hymenobacter cyanobacteriorum TaxID=2926463 RepID=A0A9X1VGY4_9BACT|nr:hypothetical protein [Hymenobacter cyanobacteriorum]MCI1189004.1 hypothetical protein [Hymenobacter cyanobacteriorum]